MSGIVYGIGVGPGDPELMTSKAIRRIKECDIIGIPSEHADTCTAYQIAVQAVPEMKEKPILTIPIPMTTNREKLEKAYDTGCAKLVMELKENKIISFLNLGDPTLYGTYMELYDRVKDAGYLAEIVSGVPSFCAVAATLGIPIASNQEMIHILPGYYHAEEIEGCEGTKILMKSAGRLDQVKEVLLELEAKKAGKAYAVTNCGMKQEIVHKNIQTLKTDAGYFTTIIVKET